MSDIVDKLRRSFSDDSFSDDKLHRDAADLIERQAAEINGWKERMESSWKREDKSASDLIKAHLKLKEAQAEIERQAAALATSRALCDEIRKSEKDKIAEIERQNNEIGRLREALRSIESNEYASFGGMRGIARAALNEHQEQPSDDPAKS